MARVLNENEVNFYRAKVTRGSGGVSVYGPYSLPNQCRDYYARYYGTDPNKVVEVQKLVADPDALAQDLVWVTIKTR